MRVAVVTGHTGSAITTILEYTERSLQRERALGGPVPHRGVVVLRVVAQRVEHREGEARAHAARAVRDDGALLGDPARLEGRGQRAGAGQRAVGADEVVPPQVCRARHVAAA
jgi:hypothetical protein